MYFAYQERNIRPWLYRPVLETGKEIEVTPEMEAESEKNFYGWLLDNRESVIEYGGQPDFVSLLRRFCGVTVGL